MHYARSPRNTQPRTLMSVIYTFMLIVCTQYVCIVYVVKYCIVTFYILHYIIENVKYLHAVKTPSNVNSMQKFCKFIQAENRKKFNENVCQTQPNKTHLLLYTTLYFKCICVFSIRIHIHNTYISTPIKDELSDRVFSASIYRKYYQKVVKRVKPGNLGMYVCLPATGNFFLTDFDISLNLALTLVL